MKFPALVSLAAFAVSATISSSAVAQVLENPDLRVAVDQTGQIVATTKADHRDWRQPAGSAGAAISNLRSGGDRSLLFDTTAGSNLFHITLSVPEKGADLYVEADLTDRSTAIQTVYPIQPFLFDSISNAAVVIADYASGHLYPLDLHSLSRTSWNLSGIDMPWIGVCDLASGYGYALIVDTDEDAVIRLATIKQNGRELRAPQAGFQASHRQFRYARRFFYHFSSGGGYVALAKRFREYAKLRGFVVPFSEKLKSNPHIARLFGAPDVWGASSLAFAREAKAAGVEKMLIHGRASASDMKAINDLGYLTSEYDNYTDIFEVEPGKRVDSTHGHLPEDAVLKADGTRMTAWLTWDKKQYMKRCPRLWLPAAQAVVPKVTLERPFLGRFIDVTTAEDLYECYDPQHALTRGDKRQCGVSLLGYIRSLGLVTGGEHGRHWAVPNLDYIEGMQSGGSFSWPAGWLKRPKTKTDTFEDPHGSKFGNWSRYEQWGMCAEYRVPLWELVFHDCVVSTWYWGDSSDFLLQAAPEMTPKKDAYNILYGTMPLLWANKEGSWRTDRETFLRTYRNTCKLHEAVAGTELLSHAFLTVDRQVQRSTFSNGTEAIVNFGTNTFVAKLGGRSVVLPQDGWVVTGPGIAQSRTIENGVVTTRIKASGFEFQEER